MHGVPAFVIGLLKSTLNDPLDNQLWITVIFVVCVVSAEMVLGILFALLMNRQLRGRAILRAILTLPLFAAPVGIGYLSRTIFYEGGGPMDRLLQKFGIDPPPWLSDPTWAKISTMIVDVWQWTPFVFVIALAGLYWFADFASVRAPSEVMPGMLLMGLGVGITSPPAQAASMSTVSREQSGMAGGIVSTM